MTDVVVTPVLSPEFEAQLTDAALGRDAIEKINAGAALTFGLYSLPADKIKALLTDAPPGFVDAFGRAQSAYGVTR